MKRFFIEEAKCEVAGGALSSRVITTVKYKEDGKDQWLSLVDVDGIPNAYLSDKDIHGDIVKEDFEDEEFSEYMNEHYIMEFDGIDMTDYSEMVTSMYDDPDVPAIPLIKYLVTLTLCDMDSVEDLIKMAAGKFADELSIPFDDVIEDYLEDYEEDDEEESEIELPEDLDKESLYRMRLSLETAIQTDSIFNDLDAESFEGQKEFLKAVKERCENEEDYAAWKQEYISSEYAKVKGNKFLTCSYLFAGIGQYETTIPEEQKESFICWINGNGSAFFGGEREATEEEIKRFIALHAGDELEGR